MRRAIVILALVWLISLAPADSLNCRLAGTWFFGPGEAVTLDPSQDLAFLGSGRGVYVIDASNPTQPNKLSEAIRPSGFVRGLCYENGHLFVATGEFGVAGAIEIWDVTTPSSPLLVSRFMAPSLAYGVSVLDTFAYVAAYDSGLRILNISDPTNPQEVGAYNTPGLALGVAVSGNFAYVADRDSGLRIVDISDPTDPQEVGFYDTPSRALRVALSGN
ncbi:MAG: hypothetical protein ABIK18_06395, partial [candidate division WOR-3 bacterium]